MLLEQTVKALARGSSQYPTADLARDHVSIRSRNYDCLPESEVRKRIGSPVGFRTYNPYVNNFQSPSQKGKVCDLFFAGIRCRDRKRQQLACLSVRFRSCTTKEQRRPQVKGHVSGSAAAS